MNNTDTAPPPRPGTKAYAKAYEQERKERSPAIKRLTVQVGHIKTQIPKLNEDELTEIREHLNAAILLTLKPTT